MLFALTHIPATVPLRGGFGEGLFFGKLHVVMCEILYNTEP